ncbi:MAG: hypothetical protein AAF436_14695 [Myxococcota bacterium]
MPVSPQESESAEVVDPPPRDPGPTDPSQLDDLVLARQIENPVSGILRIPLNNTVLFGLGPDEDRVGNVLAVAPILPALFANNWSLITRVILPIAVTVPDFTSSSGGTTGFGDMATDVLGHKALEGRKGQLYDLGFGVFAGFPTATDDALGPKRWRIGPELVLGITARRVVTVLIARNVWSVDDRDRPDINQLALEYLLFYNLPKLWYLATEPLITANWNASARDRWLVPMGAGVGKHFRVPRLPRLALTTRLQAFYNAVRTPTSPVWELNFRFVFWNPNPMRFTGR